MAGEIISEINEYLRNRYDMRNIQNMGVYKTKVLDRIETVASTEGIYAHSAGKGITHTIESGRYFNSAPRDERDEWVEGRKSAFKNLTVTEIEYVTATEIDKEERKEASKSGAGVGNLQTLKIDNMRADIRLRLNLGVKLDGTGRLGRMASAESGGVIALENTAFNFGIDGTQMITVGMPVDIVDAYDAATAWNYHVRNAIVSAKTATTITLDYTYAIGANGASIAAGGAVGAQGDLIFASGSTDFTTGSTLTANILFKEMIGLGHIVDDGALGAAGGNWVEASATTKKHFQSHKGKMYFGLDRTLYPMLKSTVYDNFNANGGATAPAAWDFDLLPSLCTGIDEGLGGGQTTAILASTNMVRHMAAKAAAQMNAMVTIKDQKVTGGLWTTALNTGERLVPIIPMNQWTDSTVMGLCEDDLIHYQPEKIDFYNPNTDSRGNSEVFFRKINTGQSRSAIFEAWMNYTGQLYSRRCDNHWVAYGLSVTE